MAIGIAVCHSFSPQELADKSGASVNKKHPVIMSAKMLETKTNEDRKIEIKLTIESGNKIYSERRHGFHIPLKLELLDFNQRPVDAILKFPTPKKMPSEFGDYYVYQGAPTILATIPNDVIPAYVRTSYHGFSNQGY